MLQLKVNNWTPGNKLFHKKKSSQKIVISSGCKSLTTQPLPFFLGLNELIYSTDPGQTKVSSLDTMIGYIAWWPFLLIWINFNPSMDKLSHAC